MSTNIFQRNKHNNSRKNTITSFLAVFIIIVIGVSTISYFLGKKHANDEKPPMPIADLSTNNPNTSNQIILGQQVYNWTGKIVEIGNSKIIISTNVKNNEGNYTLINITALIDNNTKITKWDLTTPPVENKTNNKKVLISSNDLSTGNEVIIKSTDDLNFNNEVFAFDISKLITPNY